MLGTNFEQVAGDAEKIDILKNHLNTIVFDVFWRKNQLKMWIFGQVTAILVSAVAGAGAGIGNYVW